MHGHVRVRLLDRGIGGSQDGRVTSGLVGSGEVELVGLVGLVPDLDRRQARAVALGEVGDKGGVGGRVGRRPGVGLTRLPGHAFAQQCRWRRGRPARRAVDEQDHAYPACGGVSREPVSEGQRARVDLVRPRRLHHRPWDLGTNDLGVEFVRAGDLAVGLGQRHARIQTDDVHSTERWRGKQVCVWRALGVAGRCEPRERAQSQRKCDERLLKASCRRSW